MASSSTDTTHFRAVLGQFPTGVTIITATANDGKPVGMAIGSFTSVSLQPPLVAFLPDKGSTTWPRIAEVGRFCVNVLSAEQESVCRSFAVSGADKFAGVSYSVSPLGSPVVDGVVAWIDCTLGEVYDAGDHVIVLGQVQGLDIAKPGLPLLFFRGGYGRFSPSSLAAGERDLMTHVRAVDLARPYLEALSRELATECIMVGRRADELVFLASAGERRGAAATRVGQRVPFIAPFGAPLVAWESDELVRGWISRTGRLVDDTTLDAAERLLLAVRRRGWSFGVGFARFAALESHLSAGGDAPAPLFEAFPLEEACAEPEPATRYEVRNVSAPVFDAHGRAVLQLTIYGPQQAMTGAELKHYATRLTSVADEITVATGGVVQELHLVLD